MHRPNFPLPQNQLPAGDAAKLGALGDIRLDEDYDRFYRAQVGAATLSVCML